ncbi:hypothetical protein A3B21_00920 [Candidatus Uhrbacteria bacterium RIFCSPLOWO2_01_FULL_47_24]|uniref:Response regulatory domain-containing protein n=1 Tax=Candidatus Uhrbacteria bacterium RIFCSPLOWO2_01_FULL_47_24 TaxID=1802401 RepID=A0A1F7UNY4_9BACT|nr:MAG: hypothetical protein A3D58_01085 [Candidatus Uhrbacteria bacterium RIFCSPHIGHO2_02_FULL_46_47]OGL76631.1 MAG: hypothetical protein A3F52_03605 [Candidatus Uhrbacteria bacterium RIFCSPHIGHO2_12_FULL_47_11]OGL79955.1 MAG: hypothetical protein A3B21_00920 [Candidatus Uhrbacteria bacterium RIFCSPLOWO2_01_FULL_47_24]OGL84335.1 MAG: hypothetical protein A3J03_00390 [Candidatus Uhrbacteria bacterium RIFCSPLOWO2_02_FULL_46_25]OGL91993.1 MAG: hypothetical protein A3H11_01535 [Candidatus Uhrbacte
MQHILVVDDDAALLEALETTLKAEQFQVTTARNGKEGLKKIKENKPDLVLLDIVMPQMDGITMMHKLQDNPGTKNIPIIFLTNLSDVDTISKVIREGMFDYLVKSEWDINDLVSLVKKRLKKK